MWHQEALAELTRRPDGGWSFRLLRASLPAIVVDGLTVTLIDAKFRIVQSDGGMTRRPAATVEVARGNETVRLHLAIGAPQEAFGQTFVLDDLSDGALPGLPPQFAAHLSLEGR